MYRSFTRFATLLLIASLAACASSPKEEATASTGATPVAAKDVDPKARDEYNRALAALNGGNDDQAITLLTGLTRNYPNLASPFVNLGIVYLRKGRYEDAKNALLQATTIKPLDAAAQTHLGIAYRYLGEFKKAEQSYQEALRVDPNYAYAHLNAGILYDIYLQKLPEALQHYEQYKALSKDSDDLVEKWIIDLKRRVGKNS